MVDKHNGWVCFDSFQELKEFSSTMTNAVTDYMVKHVLPEREATVRKLLAENGIDPDSIKTNEDMERLPVEVCVPQDQSGVDHWEAAYLRPKPSMQMGKQI